MKPVSAASDARSRAVGPLEGVEQAEPLPGRLGGEHAARRRRSRPGRRPRAGRRAPSRPGCWCAPARRGGPGAAPSRPSSAPSRPRATTSAPDDSSATTSAARSAAMSAARRAALASRCLRRQRHEPSSRVHDPDAQRRRPGAPTSRAHVGGGRPDGPVGDARVAELALGEQGVVGLEQALVAAPVDVERRTRTCTASPRPRGRRRRRRRGRRRSPASGRR